MPPPSDLCSSSGMRRLDWPKFTETTPPLRSLHWLPVAARMRCKTLVLAYDAGSRSGPVDMQDAVEPHVPDRSLRSAQTCLLLLHRERNTQQHQHCLLSWLLNGGTSSPITSGQEKENVSLLFYYLTKYVSIWWQSGQNRCLTWSQKDLSSLLFQGTKLLYFLNGIICE